MLYGLLLVIHVLVSAFIVISILMQASKGRGLAGIAAGGAATTVFGGRGTATLLHKVTIVLAIVFGVNCLMLGVLSKGRSTPRSVTQEAIQQEEYPLDFLGGEEGTVPIEAAEAETRPYSPVDGAGGEVE